MCVDALMVDTRRCSAEGSSEPEGGVTAAELSASEQPADHHCSPGLYTSSLCHRILVKCCNDATAAAAAAACRCARMVLSGSSCTVVAQQPATEM